MARQQFLKEDLDSYNARANPTGANRGESPPLGGSHVLSGGIN